LDLNQKKIKKATPIAPITITGKLEAILGAIPAIKKIVRSPPKRNTF
jgi:hypothetical protein